MTLAVGKQVWQRDDLEKSARSQTMAFSQPVCDLSICFHKAKGQTGSHLAIQSLGSRAWVPTEMLRDSVSWAPQCFSFRITRGAL